MNILVENLRFYTIIGLLPHERKNPQEVKIDVKISIRETKMVVDYVKVIKLIKKTFRQKKFFTVEEAVINLEKKIKKKFPKIGKLYIKILKTQILKNCEVGCELEKKY